MAWKFFNAQGAAKVASAPVGYGTSLPASPADGQEFVLVDSVTNPTYQWRFRYNAGSSNTDKWEFIGGAPAFSQVLATENINSATYVGLATAGPSFALPRAGVYNIAIGFNINSVASSNNVSILMSYDIGATGAVDGDACILTTPNAAANTFSGAFEQTKTGLTAVTLLAKYRQSTAVAGMPIGKRWMRVMPVRVS